MDIKTLTPSLSVAGQIFVSDLPAIAQAGFKSVICNRPDGEGADQPSYSEIEQAAQQAGLRFRYLPVDSGKVTDAQAVAFGELLNTLPQPVLAYCRTGMRSTTLWTLSGASAPRQFETQPPVPSGSPDAKR